VHKYSPVTPSAQEARQAAEAVLDLRGSKNRAARAVRDTGKHRKEAVCAAAACGVESFEIDSLAHKPVELGGHGRIVTLHFQEFGRERLDDHQDDVRLLRSMSGM
jgi:hypothetical protein